MRSNPGYLLKSFLLQNKCTLTSFGVVKQFNGFTMLREGLYRLLTSIGSSNFLYCILYQTLACHCQSSSCTGAYAGATCLKSNLLIFGVKSENTIYFEGQLIGRIYENLVFVSYQIQSFTCNCVFSTGFLQATWGYTGSKNQV